MLKNDLKDLQLPRESLNAIYRGVIEDNVDPLLAGRCKVRVFGVHSPSKTRNSTDGIPTDELPWAEPVLGLIEGSVSNNGFFSVPLQGSHVFVFFENGNILQPRYFGSAPGIPSALPDTTAGFNDPDGEYPSSTGSPDWNSGAGTYPHNTVLKVHGGHYVELDSSPSNKRIKIYHSTGTTVEIDNSGQINITGVNNEVVNITGNVSITVTGNVTLDVDGNFTSTVGGDTSWTSTGTVTIVGSTISLNP